MVEGGHAWLAQRYAIGFAKFHMVDGKAFTWKGPKNQNSSDFLFRRTEPSPPAKWSKSSTAFRKLYPTLANSPLNSLGKTPAGITWSSISDLVYTSSVPTGGPALSP
jgi:hypothetical protein